jgi:uncharacterized protein DUF1996
MPRAAQRRDSQVRNRFRVKLALALGVAAALGVALLPSGSAQANTAGGDFIVRCFFTGQTQPMDPILAPGSSATDHLHIFFGNLIQGTSMFPSITSGDNGGSSATMENNQLRTATNCQDTEDTAGYWMPAPYLGTPLQAYTGGGGCSNTCTAGTNMHLRVYYLPPVGSVTAQEIPDGAIMVTGFPNGCVGVPASKCSSSNGHLYPNDLNIVRYTCGDSANNTIMTPVSAWPYDCANYRDSDDSSFNDGIVAIVDFPQCWNGQAHWSPPNDTSGAKVPGYVAPWIPDPSAPVDNMGNRQNDFAYETGGACPAGFTPVVQLEERFHPLTAKYAQEGAFGEPSTCFGKVNGTVNWNNSTDNAELLNDNDGQESPDADTHPCVAASGPASTGNLSFACTPSNSGGDGNCNVQLTSGPTGCGSSGTCWIGAPQWGFETLHADYWQTWQEGVGDAYGNGANGTDSSGFPSQGYFRDLIEDCTNEGVGMQTGACSFINNTTPTQKTIGRVFSETSSNT